MPHLYPLAKLVENYPRYAAVMLDTNKARIFVFGTGTEREETVVGEKTRRTSKGGWSQARYQRRADNFHMHHMKEVVDTLDKIVREEEHRSHRRRRRRSGDANPARAVAEAPRRQDRRDRSLHEDGESGSFVQTDDGGVA